MWVTFSQTHIHTWTHRRSTLTVGIHPKIGLPIFSQSIVFVCCCARSQSQPVDSFQFKISKGSEPLLCLIYLSLGLHDGEVYVAARLCYIHIQLKERRLQHSLVNGGRRNKPEISLNPLEPDGFVCALCNVEKKEWPLTISMYYIMETLPEPIRVHQDPPGQAGLRCLGRGRVRLRQLTWCFQVPLVKI